MIEAKLYKFPLAVRRPTELIVSDAAVVRLARKLASTICRELGRGGLAKHQTPGKYHDWTAVGILFRLPPSKSHPLPCAVQVLFDAAAADEELLALDRQYDVFFPLPHHNPPPPRSRGFPFHETYAVIWRRGKRVLQ